MYVKMKRWMDEDLILHWLKDLWLEVLRKQSGLIVNLLRKHLMTPPAVETLVPTPL